MEAMRKNKKLKAIIAIVVSIIVFMLALYAVINRFNYSYVESKVITYLSQKYDAEQNEFELVKYRQACLYWKWSKNGFFSYLKWADFAFEYEYNGKKFFVNRSGNEFYDDYQLEDVEVWCTQWLQENVDNRITGVDLSSRRLMYYAKNSGRGTGYVIKKNDAEEFLRNCSLVPNKKERKVLCIIFYDESISNSSQLKTQNISQLNFDLKYKFDLNDVSSEYNFGEYRKRELKTRYGKWEFEISNW